MPSEKHAKLGPMYIDIEKNVFANLINRKRKLKIVSGITAALLLCTLLCPLRAEDDTRIREEMIKACLDKVE